MKKNICLAIIVSLCSIVALAQETRVNFTLVGTFTGTPVNKVSITYNDAQGKRHDITDTVKNNSFTFRGNIDGVTPARLIFEPAKEIEPSNLFGGVVLLNFYLEPHKMTLSVDVANLVDMKVTGTNTQKEYNEFLSVFWPVRKRLNIMTGAYYAEKDHKKQELLSNEMSPTEKEVTDMLYRFATEHPKSLVSADLAKTHRLEMSFDSLKYIYEHLAPEVKTTSVGKALEYEVKRLKGGYPGAYAVIFSKNDVNGIPISLADFKGKYVLLDFWASWCIPCRAGNPHLLGIYKRYRSKGFEIIGISGDDRNPQAWKEAINKDGTGIWRHVLRGYDATTARQGLKNPNDISEQYGVDLLPTKILIDPNGKIIGRYGGETGTIDSELEKKLASVYH